MPAFTGIPIGYTTTYLCMEAYVKKLLLTLRNIIELYIPAVSFIIMFITFILQVFFRYVIGHPLTWTNEVIVIGFVWTVIFGACYTMRCKAHVKFTLVYDKMAPKPAAWCRLLGNLIIVMTFIALIIPSYRYSFFVSFQMTPVFRISYTVIFLPFVYFISSIVGYTISEMLEDLKVIRGRIQDSEEHAKVEVLK